MKTLLFGVALLALVAGCATAETAQTEAPREKKEFVTGSNVPKRDKDGVKVLSRESLEKHQEAGPFIPPPRN